MERRSHRRRLARFVTDVLSPGHILIGLLLITGWHSTGTITGFAWGLTAALICGALPLGVVLLGVRRHWWTDVHVSVRQERFVPVAVALSANLGCIGLLLAVHAPRELTALVTAVVIGLAAGAIVTISWKVSGHAGVAGAAATVLAVMYGPWLLMTFLAVLVVGWSRVALRDHTAAQAVAGLLIGVLTVCVVFVPLH